MRLVAHEQLSELAADLGESLLAVRYLAASGPTAPVLCAAAEQYEVDVIVLPRRRAAAPSACADCCGSVSMSNSGGSADRRLWLRRAVPERTDLNESWRPCLIQLIPGSGGSTPGFTPTSSGFQ